jgi:hypothetical protein
LRVLRTVKSCKSPKSRTSHALSQSHYRVPRSVTSKKEGMVTKDNVRM